MATMIGLTGGIGSGKSVVAKVFATLGIPVFNADDEAKRIMQTSPEIKTKLIEQFGLEIYTEHGLDKDK
jgi:dephospho-CoA kinase